MEKLEFLGMLSEHVRWYSRKQFSSSSEIENKIAIRSGNSASEYRLTAAEGRPSNTHVPRGVARSSQKTGATQVRTGGRTHKQNALWAYSGVSLSLQKAGHSHTCHHVCELFGRYGKQNRLVTRRQLR